MTYVGPGRYDPRKKLHTFFCLDCASCMETHVVDEGMVIICPLCRLAHQVSKVGWNIDIKRVKKEKHSGIQ